MAKTRTLFFCTDCGAESARWSGQCSACASWNTMVEAPTASARGGRARAATELRERTAAAPIGSIEAGDVRRLATRLGDLDFVLGGGVVPGSIVLVGGEPGIGKSTLLLQVAARLEAAGSPVLYVSGEESPSQVRLRAERLGEPARAVAFLAETRLERILECAAERRPALIVIDSIQTVSAEDVDGAPGSVVQVRECAARLQRHAKLEDAAIVLVGHVTKDGTVAGPRTLEHIVDVVLYFEAVSGAEHRILRATKNRFGGADEVGVFLMTPAGLDPVANPSALLLSGRSEASGSAVAAVLGGSRPLLLEVQALCARASYGAPQRVTTGFDRQRLALLLAVLERRAGVPFGETDVFLNVVGGMRLAEPAGDLAVAAALVSTARDRAVPADSVFFGEIGLGGEVRGVSGAERRLAEAARLGFTRAFVPADAASGTAATGPERIVVPDLRTLVERLGAGR